MPLLEETAYSNYQAVPTADGSFTLFSTQYNQCYHSTKDGALIESLHKHVRPAFTLQKNQSELTILDICFGLGFNTLTTLWYNDQHDKKPLKIYTPELDEMMLKSLETLAYPEELQPYIPILKNLIKDKIYEDKNLTIELFIGDARAYVKEFENTFDIIYQDAFSPDENPKLWTLEYFNDIKKAMKTTGVLTTYSTALRTRLALYENGFNIYLYKDEKIRSSTLASLALIEENSFDISLVDMEHKKFVNPDVEPLRD
jgi:tRNA U34 5-methylaminomethyl-2-thiouridine-forming methyltransferase MnmC